jgi:hypothetical protein
LGRLENPTSECKVINGPGVLTAGDVVEVLMLLMCGVERNGGVKREGIVLLGCYFIERVSMTTLEGVHHCLMWKRTTRLIVPSRSHNAVTIGMANVSGSSCLCQQLLMTMELKRSIKKVNNVQVHKYNATKGIVNVVPVMKYKKARNNRCSGIPRVINVPSASDSLRGECKLVVR